MYHSDYDNLMKFASEGELAEELQQARGEYEERTGELFDTDASFDKRISAFLEWYALDRVIERHNKTPAKLYIESLTDSMTTPEVNRLRGFTRSNLSVFEFRKSKKEEMHMTDLLSGDKEVVFERRKPFGLESGDILIARILPFDDKQLFTEAFIAIPRDVRKIVLKSTKKFRKGEIEVDRLRYVHQVEYFKNRSERYGHLNPKEVFEGLLAA